MRLVYFLFFAVSSSLVRNNHWVSFCVFLRVISVFFLCLICTIQVRMCAHLQAHLWFAVVAVLVCLLPVFTFVSFDSFYWASRAFDYDKQAPITPLTPLAPPDQIFSFVCFLWLYARLETPICDSCCLLPASQPPNMFPHTHPQPQLTSIHTWTSRISPLLHMLCCCTFCRVFVCGA